MNPDFDYNNNTLNSVKSAYDEFIGKQGRKYIMNSDKFNVKKKYDNTKWVIPFDDKYRAANYYAKTLEKLKNPSAYTQVSVKNKWYIIITNGPYNVPNIPQGYTPIFWPKDRSIFTGVRIDEVIIEDLLHSESLDDMYYKNSIEHLYDLLSICVVSSDTTWKNFFKNTIPKNFFKNTIPNYLLPSFKLE